MARAPFCNSLAVALSVAAVVGGCASPSSKPSGPQDFVDKLSASVKSGTSKMASAVKPKSSSTTASTETAPKGKPTPNLYVALAQLHVRGGRYDEAEAAYRKALDLDTRHLEALVGFARLEDRRSNFEAATRLYRRAIKAHPTNAAIHNDLGLCYHRRGMLPEATRELKQAVELEGTNKLYRNNLAAVFVEQDKSDQALEQLVAAHGQAVGHYNLGYLLVQRGDQRAALYHFQQAGQIDRNLTAARQWVAKLSAPRGPYPPAGGAVVAQNAPRAYGAPPQPAYVAQRIAPPSQPAQYAPASQPAAYAAPPVAPQPQGGPMPPMPR